MRSFLSLIVFITTLPFSHASRFEDNWYYALGKNVPYVNQSDGVETYPLHLARFKNESPMKNEPEIAGETLIEYQNGEVYHQQHGYTFPLGYAFIHHDFLTTTLDRIEQHLILRNPQPFRVLEIGAAKGYHTDMFLFAFNQRFQDHPLVANKDFTQNKLVEYVLNEFAENMQNILSEDYANHPKSHPVRLMLNRKPILEHLEHTSMTYDVITSFLVFHFFKPTEYVRSLIGCHKRLNQDGQLYIIQNFLKFNNRQSYLGQELERRHAAGDLFPSLYLCKEFFLYQSFEDYQSSKQMFPELKWEDCMDTHSICSLEFESESLRSLLERCHFDVSTAINCYFSRKDTVETIAIKGQEIDQKTEHSLLSKAHQEERRARSFVTDVYERQKELGFPEPSMADRSPEFVKFQEKEHILDVMIKLQTFGPTLK